jgi:23S rRNA (adenine2503-C2)-methyltransferase
MEYKISESKTAPLRKIHFGKESENYYSVLFYDKLANSIVLCASSQIGCPEKCLFCATADSKFIRNLKREEISKQYSTGLNAMQDYIGMHNPKLLYIIMEGMGEPSYNLSNCLGGFEDYKSEILKQFDKVNLRITTVGNPEMILPYKNFISSQNDVAEKIKFQIQLSLHSPFDDERKYLMPTISKKHKLNEIIPIFSDLSNFLKEPFRVNYLLLDFPNGGSNYSKKHIEEILKILPAESSKLKLTKYSETNKGFKSPKEEVYLEAKEYLEKRGITTIIRELIGQDVNAACGMLNYL